jgi:hypothetical protein
VIAGLAGVALAALLGIFGGDLVAGGRELARRFLGGGRLYWSDGENGWQAVPLALSLRRHWGAADAVMRPTWTPIAPGLDVGRLSFLRPPDPRSHDVVLVRVTSANWRVRVWGRDDWAPASVATLAREAGLVLAINGPYFASDGPLGLVVSDGVIRNRQGTTRAAHFLVDAPGQTPRIVNERRAQVGRVDQGFQGFPSIMTAGRTYAYMRTGGAGFPIDAVDRRSAGCIDRDQRLLLLVTDGWTTGLSFAELATVLGALGCVDAMAFDGGASTALHVELPDFELDVHGIDPVPVVVGLEPR